MTQEVTLNSNFLDLRKLNGSLGRWSVICLILAVFIISLLTGLKPLHYFDGLSSVLAGDYSQTASVFSILETIKTVLHSTAIMLAFALVSLGIVSKMYDVKKLDRSFRTESLFGKGPQAVYLTILIEEFLFRQVFLGWLRHLFGAGLAITIVLFLLGTIIFALAHLTNYKKDHRSLWLVLPQLILGAILAFIFLKYGFWIALIVHLTYDFVLLSGDKVQTSIFEDILSGLYWLFVGLIAWLIISSQGIDLTALSPWLTTSTLTPLALTVGQTITLLALLSAIFGFLANVFVLDEITTDLESFRKLGIIKTLLTYSITALFYVAFILFLSWILGLFHLDPYTKAMVIVLTSILLVKPKSGSATASLWFTSAPFTLLYVFVSMTFGFWSATLIIFSLLLVNHIPILLNAYLGDLSKEGD